MENNNQDIITPLKRIKNKIKLLTLINKAKSVYDKNIYDGCEAVCKDILVSEPNNVAALRGMGCIMLANKEKEKAAEYFQKSLEYSENKETDYALLGTLYYIYNEFEEALKYFNLAIDLNDNYDYAYEGKNQTMLEKHLQIADLQDRLINSEFK